MKKISIIIPAYNEESNIGQLLHRIGMVDLSSIYFEKEVIVVDDGSTDNTYEIASLIDGVTVIHQNNQGKGAAVQNGVSLATGDYVLVQDGDLEYCPDDYIPMLTALSDSRNDIVVYGSRIKGVIKDMGWSFFPGRKSNQEFGPWLAGVILSFTCFMLYGKWISDTLTGYKIYPLWIIRRLKIKTAGFEADHEITAKLIKNKIEIREVPIQYSPRSIKEGKKIRAVDGLIAMWTFLRFRFFN